MWKLRYDILTVRRLEYVCSAAVALSLKRSNPLAKPRVRGFVRLEPTLEACYSTTFVRQSGEAGDDCHHCHDYHPSPACQDTRAKACRHMSVTLDA
jgi:hypothetical protein